MSMPAGNGPLVDLRPTYGAVLIGIIVSTCLLGITFAQAWRYFQNFPKDPYYLKLIVTYVLLVECIRSAFSVHGIYYYVILQWGNPLALADLVWTSEVTLLMTPLAVIAVRLYFSYRVWIISQHNWPVTGWIILVAVANLVVAIYNWTLTTNHHVIAGPKPELGLLRSISASGLSLELAADWSISLSLIYFLNRGRSAMPRTNAIINRIMFYTVNMGLITSAADIAVLVVTLQQPPHPALYSLAIFHIIGNLYANSLLASLNSRIGMRSLATNQPLSDFAVFSQGSRPENTSVTLDEYQHTQPKADPVSISKETLGGMPEQGYQRTLNAV